jgi:RND family efflux transporter MFP subunit
VSPRIDGVLDKIFVREGDDVVVGKTPLFQTDSIVLEKEAEIARQNLTVARCSVQEKEANMKVTEVELKKAESDYNRYKKLIEQKVVSQDAFEGIQTNFEKQQATLKHLLTETDLEREKERKAQSDLSIAEKNLKDALVIAPISGKVSRRMAEPGEMGSSGSPVLRIDDIVTLEASAFLPGQYYERIRPGETKVRIGSAGEVWGDYPVTYKSPTIDPTLRTFEIKCAIKGDNRNAVPGALVEMQVILSEKDALGVPVKAIQQRMESKVVFIADGNVARIVEVKTGLETDGWAEINGGKLPEKARVVVQGQFLLNDGKAIVPQKGEN